MMDQMEGRGGGKVAREEWDPGYGMHFSLTSCVTLESLSSLSEPQFPHL